jgi:hypothetical protein
MDRDMRLAIERAFGSLLRCADLQSVSTQGTRPD